MESDRVDAPSESWLVTDASAEAPFLAELAPLESENVPWERLDAPASNAAVPSLSA